MRSSRTCLLAAVLCIGSAVVAGTSGSGLAEDKRVRVDLSAFREARARAIVINVISARTLFRTNLNQDRFERYLESNGPDYVLRVMAAGTIEELTQLITGLELSRSGTADGIDLRYRLDFEGNGTRVETMYVGPFGEILYHGEPFRPRGKEPWTRRLWSILEADIVK